MKKRVLRIRLLGVLTAFILLLVIGLLPNGVLAWGSSLVNMLLGTGTAAWSFVAVSQGILGIRPDYDGLTVAPCLPDSMSGCSIKRLFRGTVYDITVCRGDKKGITVNGKPVAGNTVPLTDEAECKVVVTL